MFVPIIPMRAKDKNFGPRCEDLDNAFNKGRDNLMEKGGE